MKKEIKYLSLAYLVFLLMLILSGSVDGAWSTVVYIIGLVISFLLGAYLLNRDDERLLSLKYLTLNKPSVALTLPLVFPTVAAVTCLSILTTLVMGLFGKSYTPDVGDNLASALIMHALLPAVFEELLFRYLPLRALAYRSPRLAVIASSVFFAFIHHSFFSIPYAALAGAIFMIIDIMADSAIPSVIIHFINNVMSLIWIFCSGSTGFAIAFFVSLAALSFVSAVFIFIYRKSYLAGIKKALAKGEKYIPSYEPLLFILPTLVIAVTELL